MPGIDNLKVAVRFAINLTEGVITRLDDKKLTFLEVLGLAPNLVDLPGLIRDAELLWDELNDLDETETQQLYDYAQSEFDISDDAVEEVVENAFALVTAVANLAFSIKALKEETPEE